MLPHFSELGLDLVGTQDGGKFKLPHSLSSDSDRMCALSRGHVDSSGRHSSHLRQISGEVILYNHTRMSTTNISPWRPNPTPVDKASGKPLDKSQYPHKHQQPQPHVQQEHRSQQFQFHGREQPNLIPSSTAKRVMLTSPRASVVQQREYRIPSVGADVHELCHWDSDHLNAPWSCQSTRDQMSDGFSNIYRHGTNASQGSGGQESGPVNFPPGNNNEMEDTYNDDIRRASNILVRITEKNERSASCNSTSVPQTSRDVHSPSRTVTESKRRSIIALDEDQTMEAPDLNAAGEIVRWMICNTDKGSGSIASAWIGASLSPRSTNRQEENSESISPIISKSPKKSATHLSPRQSHNIHDLDERQTGHPVPGEFRHGQARASSIISSKTTPRVSENGGVTKRRSISAQKSQFQCTILKECEAVFSCNSLRKKHEMKHTKPFTCPQGSCSKHTTGFSTINDLKRHIKALHGYCYNSNTAVAANHVSGASAGEGGVDGGDGHDVGTFVGGWRCKYCLLEAASGTGHGNQSKGFSSTRKDNFRSHIRRIHSVLRKESESMDDFFRRAEVECRVESPVLLPTQPSPATAPQTQMDTDMDSPTREQGHSEQSENFRFTSLGHQDRLPPMEAWQALPPFVNSAEATTRTRRDTFSHNSPMNLSALSSYSSTASRTGDRNHSGHQFQFQQNVDAGTPIQGSDRKSADGYERNVRSRTQPREFPVFGQVERLNGRDNPTRSDSLSVNGWTSVNGASHKQGHAAHDHSGAQTELNTYNTTNHRGSTGSKVGYEGTRMAQANTSSGKDQEELIRLEHEERSLLTELESIRSQKKKLLHRLSQQTQQEHPAHTLADSDVEMRECSTPLWFAEKPAGVNEGSGISGRSGLLVSQLLNADDESDLTGPLSPSANDRFTIDGRTEIPNQDLIFLSPKPTSTSPPLQKWKFETPANTPRGNPSANARPDIPPSRRTHSWGNRVKGGAIPSKDGKEDYKSVCHLCQSSFRLPCQLRKHLKRHSKPFGCTHDACNKVFGAKNDWKRHENSQHHQLECWKCDIRCHITTFGTDAASICGKCFFRKADFVKHLKVVHGNTDGWLVNPDQASTTGDHVQATSTMTGTRSVVQILVDCHIPKYHGGAFWCGFCKKVIKLHGKVGIEGWDKRFDHIAWHFEKDNLRVKDAWMRLEEPSPDDDQKATGVLGTKHGEESTDDEEDVELLDSPPKRRQTEPKTLSSFSRQSENAETDKVEGARWYCCDCGFGPYITELYPACTKCGIHQKCEACPPSCPPPK